jgi:CTD small phosphatase-like protein 2
MPSIKMKHNLSTGCLKEKYGLHVCQKSSKVSKKPCSYVRISEQTAEFDTCIHKCQDGKQLHQRRADFDLSNNVLCI